MSLSATTRVKAFARERRIHLAAPRLGRGEILIWLLSAAMMLAAIAVLGLAGTGGVRPALGTMRPAAWELLVAFALAERLAVHMHFRRSAHSMSLGEIPLVFALVFTGGLEVVVTCTVGRLLVLALLRITVRADGRVTPLAALDSAVSARLRIATADHEQSCIVAELNDPWLVDHLRARGLADGLFTVLRGERDRVGVMMVGGRSGVVDTFGPEDVKLFQTLATNASVALENERLGRTVWQMTKLQGELEHQASHDSLTGQANRALFSQRLAAALDRGADEAAVIFIDVNDFKMVNDTLGHAAGDDLLVAIAGRLGECIRPTDTLARLGGDEFAVLLADRPSQDEAVEIARRIDHRMKERFGIGGRTLGVSASIGIALGDSAGVSSEELIRSADLAMYRAKRAKTDGYELFQAGMELPVLHHHSLCEQLREATRRDAFSVHYQPIVDLQTRLVTAQEALIRSPDGPRGSVTPASFIPVAEEMGVIVAIGRQTLARACHDACRWAGAGDHAAAVHVNLSPVELRDTGFLDGVHSALDRSGLAPERLVLEITEGVMLDNPAGCVEILERLRGLGVQIALDDFGTGYSSLSHLRGLPLDWLKIGAPFVDDIGPGGANRPFMRMILDLAASLQLRVVVEGIETEHQMDQLRGLGCGYGQGFHLGRPAEGRSVSAPSRAPAATR